MSSLRNAVLKLFFAGLVVVGLFAMYLDARITATFNDKMWELPAKVYARPLELFAGRALSAEHFAFELEALGYRQLDSAVSPGQFSRYRQRFDVYTRGFEFPGEREEARRVRLEFRDGRLLQLRSSGRDVDLMRLDPVQIGGIYPQHGENRLLVRLQDVPESLRAGLLAVEDRAFYRHHGFSPSGIVRAAWNNLRSRKVVAGGSTITQQLVKNYYLTPERTFWRKGVELIMAVLLEFHYDKDQILENYLNEVYLGQDGPRSVHGVALAAMHYFDTPLSQLSLPQQALLVGMIKGPSLYNPVRNPERAVDRRNVVLDVMAEQGVIAPEAATVAKAMPLGLNHQPRIQDSYPAFLDLVRRQLRQEYREEDLTTRGLSIFTTFDPLVQRQLEASTQAVMQQLDPNEVLETAAVVTRFDTGEVAALLGGRKPRFAGFNRALDARRPAGSLIKPAVYLTALEQPQRYTLASLLADTRISVDDPSGQPWLPRNFDRQEHGEVPLFVALARSYNLASARLGLEVGIDSVADTLARLGVEEGVPRVPALTLGAGEYSPLTMAAMYQSIATGGFRMPLRSIRDIVDADGEPLRRYPLEYERTVSVAAMHLLHYALRAVVREGSGRGVYRELPDSFHVAGKTGTTNDGRDSWFAGFSGDLLAVSWVGRDDNGSTGLTGSSGALRIWANFMARASQRSLAYRMPDGVAPHWIEESTGLLTQEGCAGSRLLPFIEGSAPATGNGCVQPPVRSGLRNWFERLFGGNE